ncbi:MAG: carboxypeptidase regulatory-like domain-containing protein [Sedimentisphaerales bacterium]|nr:carboxypeptidase regulatory-like domain-containing protein [Sedimentisphaerales bacterium]
MHRSTETGQNAPHDSAKKILWWVAVVGLLISIGRAQHAMAGSQSAGDLAVSDTSYGTGGTAGDYTIEINGASFDGTVIAKLTDWKGFSLPADQYFRPNTEKLYATFDLTRVQPGVYNVVVEKPGRGESVTVPEALTVITGGGGTNRPFFINLPSSIRRDSGQIRSFQVYWLNTGTNDALAPVIELRSNEAFSDDPNELLEGQGRNSQVFYGAASGDGPPGILRPGKAGSKMFYINPKPLPEGIKQDVTYDVDRLYKDPQAPFDWESIRDDAKPLDMNEADFEDVFHNMMPGVGTRNEDYLAMLSRNASLLPPTTDGDYAIRELIAIEVTQTAAEMGNSIIGLIDAEEPSFDVARIDVTARNVTTGNVHHSLSLNDGRFFFYGLQSGDYELQAPGHCHAPIHLSVVDDDAQLVALHLLRGYTLAGTVVDEMSGQAIAGAILAVHGESGTRLAITDAAGSWQVSECRGEDYSLHVHAHGYPSLDESIGTVAEDVAHLELALSLGVVIRGTFDVSGEDIDLEQCMVSMSRLSPSGDDVEDVILGDILPDGAYEIVGLYPGLWTISLVQAGVVVGGGESVLIGPDGDITRNDLHSASADVSSQSTLDEIQSIIGKMSLLSLYSEAYLGMMTAAALEISGNLEFALVNTYFPYLEEYNTARILNPPLGGAHALATRLVNQGGYKPLDPYESWAGPNTEIYRKTDRWVWRKSYDHPERTSPYAELCDTIVAAVTRDSVWDRQWKCGEEFSKRYTLEELGIDASKYSCYACKESQFTIPSIFIGGVGFMGHGDQQEARALIGPDIVGHLDTYSDEVEIDVFFGVQVIDSLDFWPDANLGGDDWLGSISKPLLGVIAWYEAVGLVREQQHSSFYNVNVSKAFKITRVPPCDGHAGGGSDSSGGSDDNTGMPFDPVPDLPTPTLPPGIDPTDIIGIDPGEFENPDDELEPLPEWDCPDGHVANPLADTGMSPCISCTEARDHLCLIINDFLAKVIVYWGRDLTPAEIVNMIQLQNQFGRELAIMSQILQAGNCEDELGQDILGIINQCFGGGN